MKKVPVRITHKQKPVRLTIKTVKRRRLKQRYAERLKAEAKPTLAKAQPEPDEVDVEYFYLCQFWSIVQQG